MRRSQAIILRRLMRLGHMFGQRLAALPSGAATVPILVLLVFIVVVV